MPGSNRYGADHRRLRRIWAGEIELGGVACARCGRLIRPGTHWDLDHSDDDRTVYLGPSHRRCNRATKTHAAARRWAQRRRFSRDW